MQENMKFCPQCGNKLPADAAFCGACGHSMAQRKAAAAASSPSPAAAPASAQGPSAGTSQSGSFTPVGIAARLAAVVTLVCMFVPWASVPSLNSLSGYASMLGFGSGGGFDYSIPSLGEAVRQIHNLVGSSSLDALYLIVLVLWLLALVGLIVGLVSSFVGKKGMKLLAAGCLGVTLVGVVWAVICMMVNSSNHYEILSVAGGCIAAIILGVVGLALSLASRPKGN